MPLASILPPVQDHVTAALESKLVLAEKTHLPFRGTTARAGKTSTGTDLLRSRGIPLMVRDTICRDTIRRQQEAAEMVSACAAIVVVGGRSSNNTRHLVEIAEGAGKPVHWVECAQDLNLAALRKYPEVGVLAGASTPYALT